MSEADVDLIASARNGDRDAMEALLAAYELRIYRFGLRMCGDEEAARDVLQETLLAAFRYLGSFRGDATLSTWLYQIARSFCIKSRRGQPALAALDPEAASTLADSAPTPDARLHAREIGEVLSRAIATLPIEQREALVLRDVEGLSAEEAAAVIGVEVGALKSRLHRARMALREQLAGLVDDDSDEACPALAQALSGYVSADIDQATCLQIEAHLANCDRCAGACEALKRSVSLCRALPKGEVPPTVRAALRNAIRAVIATPA